MAKIRDDFEGVTFVYDEDSNATALQAGDEIPEWATIGKHLLAVDETDPDAEQQDASNVDDSDQLPEEPPRKGRGSSKEAWQDYATAVGVTFPKDATKTQIIELVDAATADVVEDDDQGDSDAVDSGAEDEGTGDGGDAAADESDS